MKAVSETANVTPRTMDLGDRFKVLIEKELDGLPALVEGLTGKERLDAILKLMPIVIPKAKPVRFDANEDYGWGL